MPRTRVTRQLVEIYTHDDGSVEATFSADYKHVDAAQAAMLEAIFQRHGVPTTYTPQAHTPDHGDLTAQAVAHAASLGALKPHNQRFAALQQELNALA